MQRIQRPISAVFVVALLVLSMAVPAVADHDATHTQLQQDVADAQAALDQAQADYDTASADHEDALADYLAAYDDYLADLADHEAAVQAVYDEFDCNEQGGGPHAQCRADRDAAVAALGPAPTAPEEPQAPSSDDLDAAAQALADAVAALEVYEADDSTSGQTDGPEPVEQVTICHATNSFSNPYNQNEVDIDSILNPAPGQGREGPAFDPEVHSQSDRGWGDIVPPFHYLDGDGQLQEYPGTDNWSEGGQTIHEAGCDVDGAGQEPAPTMDFGVTVSTQEACLGDEVTVTGTNDGDTDVVVTGTLTLPDATELSLSYEIDAGEQVEATHTVDQVGDYVLDLSWTDSEGDTGSVELTVNVQDCTETDPVVDDRDPIQPDPIPPDPIVAVIEFDAQSICPDEEQLVQYLAGGSDWDQGTLAVAYGDEVDEYTLVPGNDGELAWPLVGEELAGSVTVTFVVDGEVVFDESFALDEDCWVGVEGIVEEEDDEVEVLPEVEEAEDEEELPDTGANALLLGLIGLSSLLTGGALLRRRGQVS